MSQATVVLKDPCTVCGSDTFVCENWQEEGTSDQTFRHTCMKCGCAKNGDQLSSDTKCPVCGRAI